MNKKAAIQFGMLIFVIALIVVAVIGLQPNGFIRNIFKTTGGALAVAAGGPTKEVKTSEGTVYCGVEDVAAILSSNRLGKAGTSYTNTHHLFIQAKDGTWISKGEKAEASSTTVGINTPIRVLFASNGSEDVDTSLAYPAWFEGNTDCIDPYEMKASMAKPDITPTFFITNDDGTLNSASALSLDQAEITTISVNIKTTVDEYLGNPEISQGNLLVCEVNKSSFDSVSVQGAKKMSTPTFWALENTGKTVYTYEIPKITSKAITLALDLDVDDNYDPTAVSADGINCTVIDVSYTLDADDYSLITDYEDELGNDIGITPSTYALGASAYTFSVKVS